MSSSEKCISPETPASLNPEVCVFRHIALLQVPVGWRAWLRHFGISLFDWSMETYGIAQEEGGSKAITARRLEAIGADLRTAGEQLAALGLEPEGTEMGQVELGLCKKAGKLAPEVLELAAKLLKASRKAFS